MQMRLICAIMCIDVFTRTSFIRRVYPFMILTYENNNTDFYPHVKADES